MLSLPTFTFKITLDPASVFNALLNSLAFISNDSGSEPKPYITAGMKPVDRNLLDSADPVLSLFVASNVISIFSLRSI